MENSKKGYLTIYNVKGIQKYVYGSNKVKEIVGASSIVENLILNDLEAAMIEVFGAENVVIKGNQKIEDKKIEGFDSRVVEENGHFTVPDYDGTRDAEIMYQGGGNIIVLYKDKEKMEQVNRMLGTSILLKTRGVNLLTAYTEVTDEGYSADNKRLYDEMKKVTENMPPMNTIGNLSITMEDNVTGEPLSQWSSQLKRAVSSSRFQKLEGYQAIKKEKDLFLPEQGIIAVVHLDGNNMGKGIKEAMDGVTDYAEAFRKMRLISHNADYYFNQAFETAKKSIEDEYFDLHNEKIKPFVRNIISAGDDVTYVIKAEYALKFTRRMIEEVEKHSLLDDTAENEKETAFRACAGIAYIHSHFPFYDAYNMAEALCESAKARAKDSCNRINGKAQSYIDFQICNSGITDSLSVLRKEQYHNAMGTRLMMRPYAVTKECEPSIERLDQALGRIKVYARNKQKELRDEYYSSEELLNATLTQINSHVKDDNKVKQDELFTTVEETVNGTETEVPVAAYYDALELSDIEEGRKVKEEG